jgi:hypothetical protein
LSDALTGFDLPAEDDDPLRCDLAVAAVGSRKIC